MIFEDSKNNLRIDTKYLKNLLENIRDDDDWYKIENEVFKIREWEYSDIDECEQQKARPDIIIDGTRWYPLADRPKVSDEIVYLHAICQQMAFRKLDDYRQEDDTETEFGYLCRICLRAAEKTKERYCPFCGRKLFAFPIDNYY